MTNDPIADFLIQIKNGYMAKKKKISLPYSKIKEILSKILQRTGYIGKIDIKDEKSNKFISMELVYEGKRAKLTDVIRVSKPGRRVYVKYNEIPRVLGGLGLSIISTPAGIMTDKESRKKKMGGELICKIW